MTAPQTYVSWLTLYLATKLTPAWTLLVTTNPWITQGTLFLKNNYQTEWIAFTSVTASWSNYELWWLTRDINPVTIPATSNSTGKTWLATQACVLTSMHNQLIDINIPTQLHQEAITFATTTARDTALGGNWVCQYNYTDVKVTATGLFYNYNTTSAQWEVQWTWTATPNASATVSWSVEIATTAESKAWTDTWGTWALLSVLPSDIAKNTQSWTFVYWHSTTWSDTYTVALTPTLTAYTTWMRIRILFDTSNTWACSLNVDSLGAKSIKLINWTDPLDWDITATRTYEFVYDGTNFVLQQVPERATDAIASAWVNTIDYVTPKQINLVTTWFSTVTWTSWDTSVFTATKTWYLNFYIWATHTDNQVWWVTTKIQYSTDWWSNWVDINSVSNNSSWWSWTTTTVEWSWVWHYNIWMKIKWNVTITSTWSWLVRFDYSN